MRRLLLLSILCALPLAAQTPDWQKEDSEALHRFQDLIRIDTTDPPGNFTNVIPSQFDPGNSSPRPEGAVGLPAAAAREVR